MEMSNTLSSCNENCFIRTVLSRLEDLWGRAHAEGDRTGPMVFQELRKLNIWQNVFPKLCMLLINFAKNCAAHKIFKIVAQRNLAGKPAAISSKYKNCISMRIALVAVVASCARLVSPLLLLQLMSVSSLLTAFRASSLPSGLTCSQE